MEGEGVRLGAEGVTGERGLLTGGNEGASLCGFFGNAPYVPGFSQSDTAQPSCVLSSRGRSYRPETSG